LFDGVSFLGHVFLFCVVVDGCLGATFLVVFLVVFGCLFVFFGLFGCGLRGFVSLCAWRYVGFCGLW
jgi:hypothetical protein